MESGKEMRKLGTRWWEVAKMLIVCAGSIDLEVS